MLAGCSTSASPLLAWRPLDASSAPFPWSMLQGKYYVHAVHAGLGLGLALGLALGLEFWLPSSRDPPAPSYDMTLTLALSLTLTVTLTKDQDNHDEIETRPR